jgi:heat shock protein HtpX
MTFFRRIFWFMAMNLAIIVLISTIASVFGLDTRYLTPNGLNLQALAVFSLLWGMSGAFISLLLSRWMAKKLFKIQVIETPRNHSESRLIEVVSNLAQQNGLSMPEVGVYTSKDMNAFATGPSKNKSLVAVSTGLLENMTDAEMDGVLGHEMAHIANGDMVTMALVQGVMNAFVIFAARVAAYGVQMLFKGDNDNGSINRLSYFLTSIVFEILFGMIAMVVIYAFSRHREYRADAGSARTIGRDKMIAALKKLQSTIPIKASPNEKSFATMKISGGKSFSRFFSTHPSLESRIERLVKGDF